MHDMKWAYPFATPEVELPILGYRGVADEVEVQRQVGVASRTIDQL